MEHRRAISLFIDNIVEANLRAAQGSISSGSIINIATGTRTSLNELVNLLNEIFGLHQEPVYESARLGELKTLWPTSPCPGICWATIT